MKAYQPDLDAMTDLAEKGYISCRKHPTSDLLIWNYTARAQFERVWNEHTMNCRGLITDFKGNVRARPFPKFFNYGEPCVEVPLEPFEVFDKLDGSRGISYFDDDGKLCIASRGSFMSPQAQHATFSLYSKYATDTENWNAVGPSLYTAVFEIIYPENRIVVNYDDMDDIVLLAIINTETGEEIAIDDAGLFPMPVVRRYDGIQNFDSVVAMRDQGGTGEGFVVRFASGLRMKLKFADYLRLHKILCGVTPRRIWELVSARQPLDEILECTPDEFQSWVRETVTGLEARYQDARLKCDTQFVDLGDRKANALYYRDNCDYPNLMFMRLDGKSREQIDAAIWKMCKPDSTNPFKGVSVDAN